VKRFFEFDDGSINDVIPDHDEGVRAVPQTHHEHGSAFPMITITALIKAIYENGKQPSIDGLLDGRVLRERCSRRTAPTASAQC